MTPIRVLAAIAMMLAWCSGAAAQTCADITAAQINGRATTEDQRDTLQVGLRASLGVGGIRLSDQLIGRDTTAAFVQLCQEVPVASTAPLVASTMDLTEEYATLEGARASWASRIEAPGIVLNLSRPDGAFNRRMVALAGPPAAAPWGLDKSPSDAGCTRVTDDMLPPSADARAGILDGLRALWRADGALEGSVPRDLQQIDAVAEAAFAEVCEAYPQLGGMAAVPAFLRRMAWIEREFPGGIGVLGDDAFAEWIASGDQAALLKRLLGTEAAVVALLRDYPGGPPSPPPDTDTGGSTATGTGAGGAIGDLASACIAGADYYRLAEANIDALAQRGDLRALLSGIEGPFAEAEDLASAIAAALEVAPRSCAATVIGSVVEAEESRALAWSLGSSGLDELVLQPDLRFLTDTLGDLTAIVRRDRDTLVDAIEATIRAAVTDKVRSDVADAAQTAADAASELEDSPDTAAADFPEIDPPDPAEQPQQFAITDESLVQIEANVGDRELFEAISATPYFEVPTRELVASNIRLELADLAEARIASATDAALAAVEPEVGQVWTVTDEIVAALAGAGIFAAVDDEALERLKLLVGIAYPNQRLFNAAIDAHPADLDALRDGPRNAIFGATTGLIGNPPTLFETGVAADCGCSTYFSDRVVYAFYPLWQFPPPGAEAANPAIDFETVGRVAYDGIMIDGEGIASYVDAWRAAAPEFILSAHRHQAAVDLSVRLRGWRDWQDNGVNLAPLVETIAQQVLLEGVESQAPRRGNILERAINALDRAFLSERIDGVTFFVEDYDPTAVRDGETAPLIDLIKRVSDRIGGRYTINVAMDLPLEGIDRDDPKHLLFYDFRSLLLEPETEGDQTEDLIENVLVFLERPTTDAKKFVRQWAENSFQGRERIHVLRKIVPLMPPAGHRFVRRGPLTADSGVLGNEFSQFEDDTFYFQDNFGGMGFWPAPDSETEEGQRLVAEVESGFSAVRSASVLGFLERQPGLEIAGTVCDYVCPNRTLFRTLAYATFVTTVLLIVLPFFSWRVGEVSSGWPFILMLALMVLLVLIATCTSDYADWAQVAVLAALWIIVGIYQRFERQRSGPVP